MIFTTAVMIIMASIGKLDELLVWHRTLCYLIVGRGPTSALTGGRVSLVHPNCSTARFGAVQSDCSIFEFLQGMFTTLHVPALFLQL